MTRIWDRHVANSKPHIRVLAPSRSLAIVDAQQVRRAQALLQPHFEVSFAAGVFERSHADGPGLAARLADIEAAVGDPAVDIVMSAIGGFSSGELLPYLDYAAIQAAGKLFCGFSDISVLLNNITLRSKIKTLHGPHFSTFGHPMFGAELLADFLHALNADAPYTLRPPALWGDEYWYEKQPDIAEPRVNVGPRCLVPGTARGTALGGNVVALVGNLTVTHGLGPLVLFAEIHGGFVFFDFLRWLGSILRELQSPLVAVLIGKFPIDLSLSADDECQLIDLVSRHCIGPLVLDMDFGHNVPARSFPIGGSVTVQADASRVVVVIGEPSSA